MSVKPNGTDAKEIAIYFINLKDIKATPHIMGKTINQAKVLLTAGYSKEEVLSVIDYAIINKKIDVYSLGYFSSSIHNFLREIQQQKAEEQAKIEKEQYRNISASIQASQQSEVKTDVESTERNRNKARRFNLQSRVGTKFDFDMLEE